MCGIVGIADLAGRRPTDRGAIEAMRDRLVHRGPDDAGCEILENGRIGLGHRRLAIIAPTPDGRQPMTDARGAWIVFNGEIYNYRELRDELAAAGHAFATQTDTEVILAAYHAWDAGCVEHLRGMFAFALYDPRRRRLMLARDRLGIKPLYYADVGGALHFASEPKALLPAIAARPDPVALLDYLSYGYVPGDRCAFDGIRKLPPASVLLHDASGTRISTYWDPEPTLRATGRAAVDAVRAKLDDAVRAHLVADVPLGAFLSGGVDSSAIVASAARARTEPLRTIAIDFDVGESELPFARSVAERYHTRHVEHRTRAPDALGLLDELAFTFDEPFADTSMVPTYVMCKLARRDVTVALSGDGGDELFAGYTWYDVADERPLPPLVSRLVDRVRGLPRLARAQMLLRHSAPDLLARYYYARCLFDDWELARLAGPQLSPALRDYDPQSLFARHFRDDLPPLTALQLLDLKTFLVDDILVKVDRAGMASSLEVRPPLLDHALVETAFDIAPATMIADGRGKWPLRAAIVDRVPTAVLDRAKRGFSAPISTWFRAGVADAARARLCRGVLVTEGLVDGKFIEWMIDNYSERRWAKLWSLLVLERWFERWVRA